LIQYASIERPWTRDESDAFLVTLEKQDRYIQETW
jgi:sulfite reductase alpha subunit-like flavoprotein